MGRSKQPARKQKKRPPAAAKKAGEPELVKMAELARRSSVPAPTIKHYIHAGLLPGPEIRTSKTMAYYDARLAARIRVIKELQAERFLPLRVIAELLEPAPSDKIRPDRDSAQRRVLTSLASVLGADSGKHRRKRSEVMKTFGVTRAELETLERAGVLELRGEGETAGYAGIDLKLLEILGDVRRLGLGEVFPVTVAEPYLAAVKKLVELEIDVFRHRVLSAADPPANVAEIARQAMQLGERLVVNLRAKLLPGMLEQLAKDGQ